MPVRSRSAVSIAAIAWRAPRLTVRRLVEGLVDAVADRAAVTCKRRRILDQRRRDPVVHVAQLVETVEQRAAERRPQLRGVGADRRDDADGSAERGQVARAGRAQSHARDQPLQVLDAGQVLPQTPP